MIPSRKEEMKWVPLFILFILPTALVAEFDCPGRTNCSCLTGIRGDFELVCPNGIEPPSIVAHVLPGKDVRIQCTKPEKWEQLRLLAGLKVGSVNYISLQDCPLPGSSYKELLKTMGISSTDLLQINRGNFRNTLTRKHLEGLIGTTKINFDGNSLTELPEDLFKDLREVTWLDLKNNYVQLPKTVFRYIPKLEVLELGNNNLTYLEPGIFRNLTKLRLLNLWANKLKNLSRGLFMDVSNIENLDLKSNGLINLPPDIFVDLKRLRDINLSANNFTSLPQGLFLSNLNLEKVQIHSNRRELTTLPPGLFANLTKLQNVQLQDCNFRNLSEDLLAGTISLINVSLQKNLLTTLPKDFFKDNKNLEIINLSYNKLRHLPDQLFQSTTELKLLNLASNELTSLSDHIFSSLNNLEDLNLLNNQIETISNGAFDKNMALKTINLSQNKITKFNSDIPLALVNDPFLPRSLLRSSVRLEAIYLAHNNISELYWDWILATHLQILDLSYNALPILSYSDLMSITAKKPILDLSNNNITFIDMLAANALDNESESDNEVRVVLKGNPLICDCRSYDLINYFRKQLIPQRRSPVLLDGTDFMCATGNNDLIDTPVTSVDPSRLTCVVETCVDNCTCKYRPNDKALLVDCFEKGFEQMPSFMPTNKTLKDVEKMTNHTELNLSYNRLEVLPSKLGPGYDRVTIIDLSYNNIRKLNISAFSTYIESIDLDHNNMTRMDPSSLKALKNLTSLEEITLTNNPWICDCDAISWIDYVRDNSIKIQNYNNLTCKTGMLLKEVKESEVCPLSTEYTLLISIIIAALGISIAVIAIARHYQREIKVWLYAHRMCLWFVTEEELDKDKIYDAFVSYSSLDENFVIDKLIPGLENGPTKYKLCVHYRDWIVGDYIPHQIARSVEESRRTIVVLSPNFLESVWGRMEFRAAHSQALSEGRARVILILYGDIGPTDKLDPELKAYISMNTYVKWGDPWFWDKLRYALPHPTELSKKGVPLMPQGKRQKRTSHSEKLINGFTDGNILNPSITTPPADSVILDPLKLIDSKPSKDV